MHEAELSVLEIIVIGILETAGAVLITVQSSKTVSVVIPVKVDVQTVFRAPVIVHAAGSFIAVDQVSQCFCLRSEDCSAGIKKRSAAGCAAGLDGRNISASGVLHVGHIGCGNPKDWGQPLRY